MEKLRRQPEYCFIHIGKCGGSTVKTALKESKRFKRAQIVHVSKPYFHTKTKYLIVARDPIERCISAFNWRYKLVVKEKHQKGRRRGEYECLRKYKTLSNLAEALYDDHFILNSEVAREFEMVGHLHERIDFYLGDFLKKCPPSSIVDVIMTETLSSDIENTLGVPKEKIGHEKNNKNSRDVDLTDRARKNLSRYIRKDYTALFKLNRYALIENALFESIINRASFKTQIVSG